MKFVKHNSFFKCLSKWLQFLKHAINEFLVSWHINNFKIFERLHNKNAIGSLRVEKLSLNLIIVVMRLVS